MEETQRMKRILSLLLLLAILLCGCADTQTPEESRTATETTIPMESVTEPPPPVLLEVHVISVGQADCIFVECDGETMLVDAGKEDTSARVIQYLQEQDVNELDVVVSTHGHYDHVGGLAKVVDTYPVKKVYSTNENYESDLYSSFVKSVKNQGLSLSVPIMGERFFLGGAMVTFYGPVKTYEEENDNSIVLRIDYGERSILLAADMEKAAENDMMDFWGDSVNWHADVLKIGHHGSNTSSGERFVEAVCPEFGIITCTPGATLPSAKPTARLHRAGTTLYRTDTMGDIVVTTDGVNLDITWANQEALPQRPVPLATPDYFGSEAENIFHMEGCGSLSTQENLKKLKSYDAAVKAGYSPCTQCLGAAAG